MLLVNRNGFTSLRGLAIKYASLLVAIHWDDNVLRVK